MTVDCFASLFRYDECNLIMSFLEINNEYTKESILVAVRKEN